MQNIKELRKELTTVFRGLRDGTVEPKIASEMNNSAGKIINTVKVELEYASIRGDKAEIDFLNY